jgi:hypothetical protein
MSPAAGEFPAGYAAAPGIVFPFPAIRAVSRVNRATGRSLNSPEEQLICGKSLCGEREFGWFQISPLQKVTIPFFYLLLNITFSSLCMLLSRKGGRHTAESF